MVSHLLIPALLALTDVGAGPVQGSDDFHTDSRKDYAVKGEVQWQSGRLTLGEQAEVTRKVAMGHTAEVRVVLRLPPGKELCAVGLCWRATKVFSAVAFQRSDAKVQLLNLKEPIEVIDLASGARPGLEAALCWEVCFQLRYGVARARAWRQGLEPPAEWQTSRYSGWTSWEPEAFQLTMPAGTGAELLRVEWAGVAPERPLSPDHLRQTDLVAAPSGEFRALYQRGQYPEALIKARETLAMRRKLLGPEHPQTAAALNNLGIVLTTQRDYVGARPYLEQALAIHRKVMGPDHPETATCLVNLGNLLFDQGHYAGARRHLEQALAIRRKVLGLENSATAQLLSCVGNLLQSQQDYVGARPYLEQALAVHRKISGPDHPETATCLSNLGVLLHKAEDYAGARQYYEQALAIHRKALGPDHPDTATSLDRLGGLLYSQLDYAGARRHLEQALAIRLKVFGGEHPKTARSLYLVGRLLQKQGDYARARRYLEQALAIRLKVFGPEHDETATSLQYLGRQLLEQGDYAGARPYVERALAITGKIRGPDHPETAMCLNDLGALLQDLGDCAGARRHLEEALAIYRRVLGAEHPETATSLNNLAALLVEQGDCAGARRHLEEALAIDRKILGPDHPNTARCLTNLAPLLVEQGDYEGARRHLEQALDILRKVLGPDHPETATTLGELGLVHTALGEPQSAWEFLKEAVACATRSNRIFLSGSAQRDFANKLLEQYKSFDGLLSLADAHGELLHRGAPDLAAALLDGKASAAQALLARQQARAASTNPLAQMHYRDLLGVRRELAQLLLRGPGREGMAGYTDQRHRLEQQRDTLERELAASVNSFAVLQSRQQAGPREVAARLPMDTVLLDLVKYRPFNFRVTVKQPRWGAARYAALVLQRLQPGQADPAISVVFLGEARPIEAAVHPWRIATAHGSSDAAAERTLRERLWQPLAAALPPGTQRLVIAPDGELTLFPFEALRLEDGRYLVERYAVSYVSSGRDLLPLPDLPGERGPALLVHSPDYDARATPPTQVAAAPSPSPAHRSGEIAKRGLRFTALPAGVAEAQAVAEAWKQARPRMPLQQLMGVEAAKEKLSAIHRPPLLYFITHGFFLPDVQLLRDDRGLLAAGRGFKLVPTGPQALTLPLAEEPRLRSGLALAGANQWRQRAERGLSDGLLTALDVEDLDLWGTEVVVLSACDTGLGQVDPVGEGVLGLRRAFQLAGAKTVLASLWEVPDRETAQLMAGFFRRWLSGTSKAQALRAAQLELLAELRKDPDPKRRDAPPLYWAGFICHGLPD
jgi:tetratricopeptide (TPR) repeat protein/CHAT domain-containing protein